MFPVTDFNFVVAGLATFAATVGYTATRRLNARLSRSAPQNLEVNQLNDGAKQEAFALNNSTVIIPTSEETSPPLTRQDSLKRKAPHDGFDEPKEELGYPHNLANIYPNKRSKTPTTDSDAATPTTESFVPPLADDDVEIPPVVHDLPVYTPAAEPPRTPSPVPEQASPRPPSPTPAFISPFTPSTQPVFSVPTTPRPITPKPFSASSQGFAAFAGAASPFAAAKLQTPSPFGSTRSIWSPTPAESLFGKNESAKALEAFKSQPDHAIEEAAKIVPTKKFIHVTGEEDEAAELELKGVKLYLKRGSKPFADGIVGQVKLLSHRTSGEQRILFRREPLWKVSMNVKVQPTVRCTFVPDENVLKVVLKETVTSAIGGPNTDVSPPPQEIVVYALKPGRSCSKQDFKQFAEALSQNSNFISTKRQTSA